MLASVTRPFARSTIFFAVLGLGMRSPSRHDSTARRDSSNSFAASSTPMLLMNEGRSIAITEIMPTNRGYRSSAFCIPATHESKAIDSLDDFRMGAMDYKKEIGARIRKARELRNWSQVELARETGDLLSETRIGNYEVGFRMPGPAEVVILGRALGIKPSYLMALENSQLQITQKEEALIKNWRTLSEKDRMEVFRDVEMRALQSRDPAPDHKVARTIGPAPIAQPKRARLSK